MDNPAARAFGALSRRVRTLIVSGALFLVLLVLALTLPVPYVILSPGPTCNTIGNDDETGCGGSGSPIIVVKGITQQKTDGNLNLTTVGVSTQKLTVFDALSGWLQSNRVVVPRSSVFPPGESDEQVQQQNTQDFTSSQDNATQASACELGYRAAFGVIGFSDNSPSDGKLRVGDAIVSVDGKAADTYAKLKAVLGALKPGTNVPVVVTHASKDATAGPSDTVMVTLGDPPKGTKSGASLGIEVPPTKACLTPYTVDLGLGNEIGGPSAGLMFALGIMDKVGTTNLTDGRFIAGTGTITPDGKVGPIGGIALKMIAARDQGASVFLAPADNCDEVRDATPSGLQVVKVSTLHDAVQDLQKLQQKQSVPGC